MNSPSIQAPEIKPNKWLIGLSVIIGAFMGILDVNIVNVSLPHMMGTFGQNLSSITWVATAYSIAAIIMMTMSGWWATLIGRRNFYLASFVIFTIGSILVGMAHTFPELIICRIIQGIGGGSMVPLSQAIIRETFPKKEQGMAMALFSMGILLAPAVGPVLGGWLTDQYNWRWIFYINVPISIIGILMVGAFVQDPPHLRRGVKKIDVVGIVLLALGLTALQTFLERGQQENWFDSTWITWTAVVAFLSLLSLVLWELSIAEPVVNFRIFKNKQFRLGATIIFLFGITLYGTTFIIPQFTMQILHYTSYQAGIVMMPRALALLCILPIVGRLHGHIDDRILILFGITTVSSSCYLLAHLATTAAMFSIIPLLVLMGTGLPCVHVTTITLSLSSIEGPEMTSASALFNLSQQVGGNIGYAAVATLLERGTQIHHNYLAAHINQYNAAFQNFYHHAVGAFFHKGMALEHAKDAAMAMTNNLVNRQAAMMAYNDIEIFLMSMFLLCVPFVLMVPVLKKHSEH